MNQQHVQRSIKPVPSLLPNLSTKKIHVFINNTRSVWYNNTTGETILQEILSLINGFKHGPPGIIGASSTSSTFLASD